MSGRTATVCAASAAFTLAIAGLLASWCSPAVFAASEIAGLVLLSAAGIVAIREGYS